MRSSKRFRIDLRGFWDFTVDPDDAGEFREFYRGFRSSDVVYVPSSYNEQNPAWDNYAGVVWYQRRFFIPRELSGRKVWLVFDGAGYIAKVWLNGVYLGSHECSYTRFKFDATGSARVGDWNTLVVKIDNRVGMDRVPPGRGLNEVVFDFYPYGGIHRDVYLEFTYDSYIEDVVVLTDHTGYLKIDLYAACSRPCSAVFRLFDAGDREIFTSRSKCVDGKASVESRISTAVPWEPENPYLYRLEVELLTNDTIVDVVEEFIGFRSVAVINGKLILNGKPVFLKGFGRHEDYPVTGKYVPGSVLVRDFYLMKNIGANSFRTSHYPYSDEHLDMADRFGFMVILETPVCLSGLGRVSEEARKWCSDPSIVEKVLKMAEEMVKQHRNRPSVIMYSIMNEPPTDLDECAELARKLVELIKKLDPSRPVTLASHRRVNDKALQYLDVISLNFYYGWYTEWGNIEEGIRKTVEEVERIHGMYPDKPIIITEFGADAVAGLHHDPPLMWTEEYQAEFIRRYVEELSKKSYIQGLHIWNFADFRTPQNPGRTVLNRKGVFTRDRQPKLSARIVQELFNKIPTYL